MRVLEWREAARADLLAIVDYISDDNPDAAQRLKDDIEAKAAKLPERPKLYRPGRVAGEPGDGGDRLAAHLQLCAGPRPATPQGRMNNRLRELRDARGWSQGELAERLEVSRQTVNALETGKYDPSLPLAFRIARLFGQSIETLFIPED